MDIEQKKYLKERLDKARNEHQRELRSSQRRVPVPAVVRTARELVAAFERKQDAQEDRKCTAINRAAEKVREAIILSGDAKKALALLTAFEKSRFV
jgi:hypothetical protein